MKVLRIAKLVAATHTRRLVMAAMTKFERKTRNMGFGALVKASFGEGFSSQMFHYVKTDDGWYKVKNYKMGTGMFYGEPEKRADMEQLSDAFESGNMQLLDEGVTRGQKIEHPIHIDALPAGSEVKTHSGLMIKHRDGLWRLEGEPDSKGASGVFFEAEIHDGDVTLEKVG